MNEIDREINELPVDLVQLVHWAQKPVLYGQYVVYTAAGVVSVCTKQAWANTKKSTPVPVAWVNGSLVFDGQK
jgi:hypothetical protein